MVVESRRRSDVGSQRHIPSTFTQPDRHSFADGDFGGHTPWMPSCGAYGGMSSSHSWGPLYGMPPWAQFQEMERVRLFEEMDRRR